MKVQVEFQEPDRKKRIKRIIAREGLVIVSLLALAVFCSILSINIPEQAKQQVKAPMLKGEGPWGEYIVKTRDESGRQIEKVGDNWYLVEKANLLSIIKIISGYIAFWAIFIAYPMYLLIRFIIWAVRTLKER
jgi:hypothetical protein